MRKAQVPCSALKKNVHLAQKVFFTFRDKGLFFTRVRRWPIKDATSCGNIGTSTSCNVGARHKEKRKASNLSVTNIYYMAY